MSMEFKPVGMTLPDGGLLTIEKVPPTVDAAEAFLAIEGFGYKSAYTGTPCKTQDGEPSLITEEDAASVFSPKSTFQVHELLEIAAGRYERKLDITLLQGSITEDDKEPQVAGILNLRQRYIADIQCDHPEGGEVYDAKIHELHVHPDCRERRVGATMLMVAVNAIARTYHYHPREDEATLMLHSGTHNHGARNWYERLGIKKTGHNMDHEWPNGLKVPAEERAVGIAALNACMQERYGSL